MKKILFLILFIAAAVIYAFEWPVADIVLTGTFCENRGDHFHSGIDIGGGEQDVSAIAEGEVVFYYEEGVSFSSVPVGLGSYVLLQHEGGIRSLYCHLKKDSLDMNKKQMQAGEVLGKIGDTGHSIGKHLHLTIIDHEIKSIINPLVVLPAIQDIRAPVVNALYYEKDKKISLIESGLILPPGDIGIYVDGYDLRDAIKFNWPLAPYEIFLYKNGQEVQSILFDALSEYDGSYFLKKSQKSFAEVYKENIIKEDLIYLGMLELNPGKIHLQVLLKDFSGKEASKEAFIDVRIPE